MGAAVAAGMGPLSVGTDGAGSVRIPAAFCGNFGLKPSFGRVPAYPLSPMGTVAHIGPQRVFVLPPGILNPRGDNTLALAVTTDGQPANTLEPLKLLLLNHQRGGVPLDAVAQPRQLQR